MISNISISLLRERVRLEKIRSYDNLVLSIERRIPELDNTDPLKEIYVYLTEMQITNEADFIDFEGRRLESRNQTLVNLVPLLSIENELKSLILDCMIDASFEFSVAKLSERELLDSLTKNRKLFTCEICVNGVYQNDKFRQCDVIANMTMAIARSCNRFQPLDKGE
ncbi:MULTISPECIES: hypothetical protein [unclassified Shewanella]|uniref:hypothetical protein n=1 Tax=unclassified Shewanella TaxID=196818 RepID=UPI00200617C6|nr:MULTISPECIES: hypothetical protein [unclassified Shewanella]MCK7633632.1 hypothetical protein [Shewanella sp. JNE17]MCK7648985.1 hypothetical protein [Shewanella sp. JNE8]MCK7656938.1 hypothetical protein [Shewanella sp. JNE4-2]UPO32606.1 hypothetical protein MZ182_07150 [Shewanella sp. JNE2]